MIVLRCFQAFPRIRDIPNSDVKIGKFFLSITIDTFWFLSIIIDSYRYRIGKNNESGD